MTTEMKTGNSGDHKSTVIFSKPLENLDYQALLINNNYKETASFVITGAWICMVKIHDHVNFRRSSGLDGVIHACFDLPNLIRCGDLHTTGLC